MGWKRIAFLVLIVLILNVVDISSYVHGFHMRFFILM